MLSFEIYGYTKNRTLKWWMVHHIKVRFLCVVFIGFLTRDTSLFVASPEQLNEFIYNEWD